LVARSQGAHSCFLSEHRDARKHVRIIAYYLVLAWLILVPYARSKSGSVHPV
jgi:hypothetical protein